MLPLVPYGMLETVMEKSNTFARSSNDSNGVRTFVVSAFGLLPVALVSSMMLTQMFGIWTY